MKLELDRSGPPAYAQIIERIASAVSRGELKAGELVRPAATALGVPLTHRALCHGAIFVTAPAHEGAGPDWKTLVAFVNGAKAP